MADLTAFSGRTFETTQWINNTLRDRPEEEHLESYLASIAMKLHIISQDYTDQLETGTNKKKIVNCSFFYSDKSSPVIIRTLIIIQRYGRIHDHYATRII